MLPRLMFRGVSLMSKYFKGVMISESDRTEMLVLELREFSALMLWVEKKMTLFSIYCRVSSSSVFCLRGDGEDWASGYIDTDMLHWMIRNWLVSL